MLVHEVRRDKDAEQNAQQCEAGGGSRLEPEIMHDLMERFHRALPSTWAKPRIFSETGSFLPWKKASTSYLPVQTVTETTSDQGGFSLLASRFATACAT